MKENIFLVGFSGTGKSSTGKLLARQLGYDFLDTDLQIEANTGRAIPAIFSEEGESAFRQIESDVLAEICRADYQIVSTGGGMVLSAANRAAMLANGYVICLEARPETIYVRLLLDNNQREEAAVRPLLQGGDPYSRIVQLKAEREPFYALADWTIHTDFLSPQEVVAEIERTLPLIRRRGTHVRGSVSPEMRSRQDSIYIQSKPAAPEPSQNGQNDTTLRIKHGQGYYRVLFEAGLLDRFGELLKEQLPDSRNRSIFVISDGRVGPLYGERLLAGLTGAGYRAAMKLIPAGEQAKSLEQAAALYEWLAGERAERKDFIVALGGGVIGDLSGFVAATWLRGVNLVHVPTTLLAMVDSSIGGKTGVNLPQGKNLVGSIYPPRLVVSDVGLLASLPERERRSGWAEVIKHAIIPGADPDEQGALRRFQNLLTHREQLLKAEPLITGAILRESVAVKAGVVEQDERESDLRLTLNYGHTYAHAIESATNYSLLLHGEAVAIGMHGVALLAQRLGYCDTAFVEQQRSIIEDFGFALAAPFDPERALASLGLDKKTEGGATRWILPLGVGKVEVRRDVPLEAVREVIYQLVK